ncbi:MAG: FG-GAP-like repeat-containing protein [Bacteroidota bacterium]
MRTLRGYHPTAIFWPLFASLLLLPYASQGQVYNYSGQDSTIFISHTIFLPKYAFSSGKQNWSICQADFNQDGKVDIATASKTEGKLYLHLNEGGGSFSQKIAYQGYKQLRDIIAWDLNQDGWMDIAGVSLSGRLCFWINTGQGRFATPRSVATAGLAHGLAAADFNLDGHTDFAVASIKEPLVYLHLGQGNQQFSFPRKLESGKEVRAVWAGLINQDSLPDLIAGCDDGYVYLYYNLGGGDFEIPIKLRAGAANWAVGSGDLNGDSLPDIVSASYMDKFLTVYLQTDSGTFYRSQKILSGDHNFDLVIEDMDQDGDLDVVTCSTIDEAINFHLNLGQGKLAPREALKSGNWNTGLVSADVDGDGDPDLISTSINDQAINIHRNISANLAQRQAPAQFCLSGQVWDGENKRLLKGSPITLQDSLGQNLETQATDAEGRFHFCPPTGRTYGLKVRTPAFPIHEEQVFLPAEGLTHDVYLYKPKTTWVYGLVYDKYDKSRIADADVILSGSEAEASQQVKTDSKGRYKMEVAFGADYSITGASPWYAENTLNFSLPERMQTKGKRLDIPLEIDRTNGLCCIFGTVRDVETLEAIARAGMVLKDSMEATKRKFRVRPDGTYQICLPAGEFQFGTQAQGYFYRITEFVVTDSMRGSRQEIDILLDPLRKEAKMVMKHIYFDVDKADLRDESLYELGQLSKIMQDNPSLKVEIAGHTDSDATDAYNQTLSQNRAESVVDFLMTQGIAKDRISAVGYGESQPVAPNDSPENKQLNRRTECKVVDY